MWAADDGTDYERPALSGCLDGDGPELASHARRAHDRGVGLRSIYGPRDVRGPAADACVPRRRLRAGGYPRISQLDAHAVRPESLRRREGQGACMVHAL